MVSSLAFYLFLGKPLIMYGGILTFLSLLFTAAISIMNKKGIFAIPFKWHPRMAVLTIIIGTIHAIFGLSIYFNF
ncbi:MAG TPA: hypothetical protein VF390_00005 [Patescibacteria group bacterium]